MARWHLVSALNPTCEIEYLDFNVSSKIVLNNWLLNPTGKRNAFVEVDLVQEHLNFWIKVFTLLSDYFTTQLRPLDDIQGSW